MRWGFQAFRKSMWVAHVSNALRLCRVPHGSLRSPWVPEVNTLYPGGPGTLGTLLQHNASNAVTQEGKRQRQVQPASSDGYAATRWCCPLAVRSASAGGKVRAAGSAAAVAAAACRRAAAPPNLSQSCLWTWTGNQCVASQHGRGVVPPSRPPGSALSCVSCVRVVFGVSVIGWVLHRAVSPPLSYHCRLLIVGCPVFTTLSSGTQCLVQHRAGAVILSNKCVPRPLGPTCGLPLDYFAPSTLPNKRHHEGLDSRSFSDRRCSGRKRWVGGLSTGVCLSWRNHNWIHFFAINFQWKANKSFVS